MRNRSLLFRLMNVMLVVVLVQLTIGVILTLFLGVIKSQYNDGYANLSYIVERKASEIESTFNSISTQLMNFGSDFNNYANSQMESKNISSKEISINNNFVESLFLDKSENFTNFLYSNPNATGFFVIIGDEPLESKTEGKEYPSLYIRKKTTEQSSYTAKEYWVLKFGSQRIAEKLNIQFDYLWDYYFRMELMEKDSTEFFDKPIKNATAINNHYFISSPFRLSTGEGYIITQTLPLVDKTGYAYGVIGVEMDLETFGRILNVPQLPGVRSGFYSITNNIDSDFTQTYVNSTPFSNVFLTQENLTFKKIDENYNTIQYHNAKAQYKNVLGTYSKIRLYYNTSPYINGTYVLYGFVPNSELLRNAELVQMTMIVLGVLFTICSLLMAILASIYVTKPILKLSKELSECDIDKAVAFSQTGIKEIDQLSSALNIFSTQTLKSASRLSTIIDLCKKQIGGFEEDYEENKAYVSASLYKMFEMPNEGKSYISLADWKYFKEKTLGESIPGYEDVYVISKSDGELRYVRLYTKQSGGNFFGVITDITEEMIEKRQLEYERDVEPLTKLYNRAAFHKYATDALQKNADSVGALMFFDIDNLKYINDSYGHEYGDEYIILMSDSLREFEKKNGIVARISGDEFVAMLVGYDSQEEVREIMDEVFENSKKRYIVLPDGTYFRLRCSIGVAWYPKDALGVKQLVKYADFAMYEIKHSNKGESKEFDLQAYNQKSFLKTKLEILNNFIENELLYFAFQPIVDAKTGKIFAYEALMRSKHRDLVSPYQILQLAKSQSKLYPLERLVTSTAVKYLAENLEEFGDRKLFVNSIQSESLNEEDFNKLKMLGNEEVFSHIVLELTESEQAEAAHNAQKVKYIRQLGIELAIDDFGSGYSNDISIITNSPEYIKVDMSIIQGIHIDNDKKQRLKDLISYATVRNIKIIAEGIETFDDLKTLATLGVDFYQGYLFYKPLPELVKDDPKVMSLINLTK